MLFVSSGIWETEITHCTFGVIWRFLIVFLEVFPVERQVARHTAYEVSS